MALVLANRVQETATANTTVSFTLTGAVLGFQTFAVIGDTNTTFYSATDTTGNWEVGLGTYSTTGPTLTRTTVYASSNGGLAETFVDPVTVFVTYPSGRSVNLDAAGNVSALGTVASGTWQGSTIGVAYGGTGVTSSSGANSVVLRDANQNISVNRLNQANTDVTAAGGTTALTAASTYSQTLIGTGSQTFTMPDATTLTTGVAFIFNNNATGTVTLQDYATGSIGTITSGGAVELVLLANGTVAGTWDVHGFLPENVTWGTNALNLGSTVISNGTWQGGTIQPAYGGTGLTTFVGANNALYSTGATTLTAGTLPVAAGGTGITSFGTGVASALGTNVGTAGSFVVNGGALGTPSSGTVTNLTGTASININGTVGATTPNTGAFTTLTTAGNVNLGNSASGFAYTTRISGYGVDDGGLFGSYGTVLLNANSALTSGARRYMITNAVFGNTFAVVRSTNSTTDPTLGTTGTITSGTADFVLSNSGYAGFGTTTPFAKLEVTDTTGILTRAASTQDGVALVGRAGGSSSYTSTLTPTTLSANRTLTLPDNSGTVLTTGATVTIAQGGTGQTTANAAFNALAPSQGGNSGKYLTTNGTDTSWGTVNQQAALSNDTSTASNLYPLFAAATSGTPTTLYTSNAQYLFKPSTGELSVKAPRASNGIVVNSATVSSDYTIASGDNGLSAGPVTVNSGITVTVSSGSVWSVV